MYDTKHDHNVCIILIFINAIPIPKSAKEKIGYFALEKRHPWPKTDRDSSVVVFLELHRLLSVSLNSDTILSEVRLPHSPIIVLEGKHP
jgi:hypothetical protein